MPSSAVAWKQLLDHPELAVAADERRLQAAGDFAAAADARHDPAARATAGPARPCPSARARRRPRTRWPPRVARRVASPTRTGRASAADWTREAVFTRSPATIPWPSAPMVTAASPVRTPARARRSGAPTSSPSAATASVSSRAARTARSASSSFADRGAPDRHHRVADELLDRAAVAADRRRHGVEVAGQELADLLGVAAPRRAW